LVEVPGVSSDQGWKIALKKNRVFKKFFKTFEKTQKVPILGFLCKFIQNYRSYSIYCILIVICEFYYRLAYRKSENDVMM